eukprot:1973833-Amphidinium_carterae.1
MRTRVTGETPRADATGWPRTSAASSMAAWALGAHAPSEVLYHGLQDCKARMAPAWWKTLSFTNCERPKPPSRTGRDR